MGKLLTFILAVGLAVAAYAWLSPYRTVQNLTQALENEDTAQVDALVDFDRVRASFNDDFARRMGIDANSQSFGDVLASRIAGAFISSIVSPETMVAVLKDKSRRDRLGLSTALGELTAQGSWHSFSQFVLRDTYGAPTMLLERDGARWQVVAISLN